MEVLKELTKELKGGVVVKLQMVKEYDSSARVGYRFLCTKCGRVLENIDFDSYEKDIRELNELAKSEQWFKGALNL